MKLGTLATATTAAFAGGALLTQIVIVPSWQAASPEAFLARFATEGPATGATVFPFELASLILTTIAAFRRPAWPWVGATACLIGTFALLAYFVPANLALLDPGFPPGDVARALADWNRWDWVRAGLAVAAAGFAATARLRSDVPADQRAYSGSG
ncbi:DUF1772 domain-containing protein [Amycolatopsis sp. OK19-0408]|uniref:DUF1772 domain-containing protein n=1 Tax=Amycolatopsis iheyensis TaxID=2945988 RepID=A0A9X2NCU4_9PSEU|nr:DUF1772 domain-containing protein [Amycolatopsis iheyensis]MCR6484926.1 DUF1772 domain-containing protein [Amycolatopsis iheyensis]